MYFEDLTRGTNKEFGPKDFFEIASNKVIYDQWSYMTLLLHLLIPPRPAALIKYYVKYHFVRLNFVELKIDGTKCER